MPPESCFETARDRATILARSTFTFSAEKPNSGRWSSMCFTSAERSSALVGMQPQLRQMPPRCLASTTATFIFSCAARMAAT